MDADTPQIDICAPRWFRFGQILVMNAYELILLAAVIPIGAAPLIATWFIDDEVLLLLILLAALFVMCVMVAASLYFIPFLLANGYASKLVRRHVSTADMSVDRYTCQIALTPRIHSGLRGFLEDADDIGVLTIGATHVRFEGDSVRFSIPFTHVVVEAENIGIRAAWISGQKIRLRVRDFGPYESVVVIERGSLTTPTARRTSAAILNVLRERSIQAGPPMALPVG